MTDILAPFPCPICGWTDFDLKATATSGGVVARVKCTMCGAVGPEVMAGFGDDAWHMATSEWNKMAGKQEDEAMLNLKSEIETIIAELTQMRVDDAEDALTAISDELATGDKTYDAQIEAIIDGIRWGARYEAAVRFWQEEAYEWRRTSKQSYDSYLELKAENERLRDAMGGLIERHDELVMALHNEEIICCGLTDHDVSKARAALKGD